MKKTMSLLALTLTAALGLSAQEVKTNETFSIALPAGYGEFAKQTQTVKSPEGDIETTTWVSKAPTNEAVVVTLSKMPKKILNPEKLIASTRESLLKSLGATAAGEQQDIFQSANAWFRTRYVVEEDRFYQVLYVGRSDEQRAAPAVATLFESFAVVAPAAAPQQAAQQQ